MSQTKRHSLIESLFNVLIGYGISCAANIVVLPMYGFAISTSQALSMGLIFTVISIVRSYVLRRLFNRITNAKTNTTPDLHGYGTSYVQTGYVPKKKSRRNNRRR